MATKGHIVEDRSYGELIGESKELQVLSRGGSLDDGEMREYKKEKRGGQCGATTTRRGLRKKTLSPRPLTRKRRAVEHSLKL